MDDREDAAPDDGPDDEELAALAEELSTVLRELRDELRASREAGGGELVEEGDGRSGTGARGGPEVTIDLPSASDVLAFTDERLIPAAIAVLEANIRALELLQKGIRWARPDRAGENAERVRSHAESVSRSTLQRLDSVLADLQDAAGEGALPENAEASGIITEARRLRDEIDAALEERAEDRGGAEELPGDDGAGDAPDEAPDDGPPSPWDEPPEVDVDVEGELESIKAELGKIDEDDEDGPEEDESTGEAAEGTSDVTDEGAAGGEPDAPGGGTGDADGASDNEGGRSNGGGDERSNGTGPGDRGPDAGEERGADEEGSGSGDS